MSAAFSAFYRSTANHDACQAVAPQAGRHEKTGRRRLAAYYCGWTTQSFACVFGHDGEQSVRLGIILGCLLLTLATGFAPARADERLSLVFVGDTGLNASGARVSAEGGIKSGRVLSVDEALAEIDPLLKGDMVFANLETVVTDNNNIAPHDKMFVFRMHPAGARALLRAGINVFSTANNHAMDFGTAGADAAIVRGGESPNRHLSIRYRRWWPPRVPWQCRYITRRGTIQPARRKSYENSCGLAHSLCALRARICARSHGSGGKAFR